MFLFYKIDKLHYVIEVENIQYCHHVSRKLDIHSLIIIHIIHKIKLFLVWKFCLDIKNHCLVNSDTDK